MEGAGLPATGGQVQLRGGEVTAPRSLLQACFGAAWEPRQAVVVCVNDLGLCGGWAEIWSKGLWAYHRDAGLLPTARKVGEGLCLTGGLGGGGEECSLKSGGG